METIFLTASRETLLNNVANRHLLGVKSVLSNSLEGFYRAHGQNIAHIKFLFVDLIGLIDNNDEIVETISILTQLNSDLRIIVLADIDEESAVRRELSELLRRICAKGVNNIIVSLSEEEIDHCITVGKTEDEARLTFAPKATIAVLEQNEVVFATEAQKAVTNLFAPKVFNAATQKDDAKPAMARDSPILPKRKSTTQSIRADKSFRKYKDYVSVGICGTQSHVGTTHTALQTVRFLKDAGFNACYVEAHNVKEESGISIIRGYYPQISMDERKSMLQMEGLNIFHTGFDMVRLMSCNYDFYVFDLGVLDNSSINQFLMRDVKIVVSGSKPWEIGFLQSALSLLGVDKGVKIPANVLINFSAKTEEVRILNTSGRGLSKHNTFFLEYNPNPFKSGFNISAFKAIFNEYIL